METKFPGLFYRGVGKPHHLPAEVSYVGRIDPWLTIRYFISYKSLKNR
jgi:hypothetical protein